MDFSQNLTSVGLRTITLSAPAQGPYVVKGKLSLPTIADDGESADDTSQVVVTVTQNGSTKYTGLPGAEGFKVNLLCNQYDLIAIITSSSAAIDQPLNVVKAAISLSSGV